MFLAAAVVLTCSCDTGIQNVSWTIMFYANGDNNLENSILSDIKEMELAVSPVNITVIALVDRPSSPSSKFGGWSDTKLFRIVHGDNINTLASEELDSSVLSLTKESSEELDLSDASVITKFISFCKSAYPSDRYALIIGSHGDGWKPPSLIISKSIGYDSTSHNSSTGIEALSRALRLNPPDLIIFDACNMGNIETLYELTGCAQYIVASPNPLPLSGFNYTDALASLNADLDPEHFSLAFSESFQRANDDITMMVYDMESFSGFMQNGDYINAIADSSLSDPANSLIIRNESIRYSVSGVSDHIDIVDYSRRLIPGQTVPFSSFILTENTPMLSVYFPTSAEGYNNGYEYTHFSEDTLWNETLKNILD